MEFPNIIPRSTLPRSKTLRTPAGAISKASFPKLTISKDWASILYGYHQVRPSLVISASSESISISKSIIHSQYSKMRLFYCTITVRRLTFYWNKSLQIPPGRHGLRHRRLQADRPMLRHQRRRRRADRWAEETRHEADDGSCREPHIGSGILNLPQTLVPAIDRFCSGRFNVDSMTFRVNYVAWPESRRTRCHRTLILLIPLDP